MTVITKEHIDHHCKTLSISREELTDFTIPDGVKKIGRWAFNNCASLKSITIPNGVINIEWNTFQGCTSLTSITIPDSVTRIGGEAFTECTSLAITLIYSLMAILIIIKIKYNSSLLPITLNKTIKIY